MVVDQNYFIRKRPFFVNKHVTVAKLSQTPRSSFAEPMLGNNASYEDSFTTCQSTPENHGSLLDCLLNMQLASRNPFSGQIVADSVCFWQGLLTHPLQHGLRLSPAPSQNFRGPFAEISLFTDPGHQRGSHRRKSEHQGPWCLALAKPPFWKLGCCMWSFFLDTSKSIIRQWQRQVQGCASGPWCLAVAKPHLWKLGCYLWRHHTGNWTRTKPKFSGALLLPDPGRQWVAARDRMRTMSNFRETFADKKVTFANAKKNFRTGFQHNMNGLRN